MNQRPALELPREGGRVLTSREIIRAGNRTRRSRVRIGRRERHGHDGQRDQVPGLPDEGDDLLVAGLSNVLAVDLELQVIFSYNSKFCKEVTYLIYKFSVAPLNF